MPISSLAPESWKSTRRRRHENPRDLSPIFLEKDFEKERNEGAGIEIACF
jgi:hypothetical protein